MRSPSTRCIIPLALVLVLVLAIASPSHSSEEYNKARELVYKATTVYKSFMTDANMTWVHQNVGKAKGIFIVPQMLRGGFIIGGAGGSGVLLSQNFASGEWSYPAFYTMGSVSFGLQIGEDASEIILMVMTQRGLDAMLATEFKLGADVAVAAGPVGGSAKAQTADILAFGRSKGAFGGVSIEGAVIAPRNDWNAMYYDKPVKPVEILMHRSVSNPDAEQLRLIMPRPAPTSKPLGS